MFDFDVLDELEAVAALTSNEDPSMSSTQCCAGATSCSQTFLLLWLDLSRVTSLGQLRGVAMACAEQLVSHIMRSDAD